MAKKPEKIKKSIPGRVDLFGCKEKAFKNRVQSVQKAFAAYGNRLSLSGFIHLWLEESDEEYKTRIEATRKLEEEREKADLIDRVKKFKALAKELGYEVIE